MIVIHTIANVPSAVVGLFKKKNPRPQFPILPTGSECLGCFEPRAKIQLHDGAHRHDSGYCGNCWLNFIRFRISEAGVGRVDACPSSSCKHKITEADLHATNINHETITLFNKFVNGADLRYLPCPRCKKGIEHSKDAKEVTCTNCSPNTQVCVACGNAAHANSPCPARNLDEAMEATKRLLLMRGFRQCPGCQEFVERNEGCFHMYHQKCDSHFCYDCGAKLASDGGTDAATGMNHFPGGSCAPCINSSRRRDDQY